MAYVRTHPKEDSEARQGSQSLNLHTNLAFFELHIWPERLSIIAYM